MDAKEKALNTPMMQQYLAFKKKYSDAILFFRLGDFYEMFFEDAVEASQILGITLTSRHKDADIPLAGIPYHAADQYIKKLLEAGRKVAVCEQTEKPDKKKKTVARDVVRILTPGTVVEESSLSEESSTWLMAVTFSGLKASPVWVDVSCGNIYYSECQEKDLDDLIQTVGPKEIVLSQNTDSVKGDVIDKEEFERWGPSENALEQLELIKETGLNAQVGKTFETIIFYLDTLYFGKFPPLRRPLQWQNDDCSSLDYNTTSHLELERTLIGGKKEGSLLWAIDRTQTPMGKRLLSNIIKTPLKNREKILSRQMCVTEFIENPSFFNEIRSDLSKVKDFERTLSRILVKRGGPREIQMLADSVKTALEIRKKILTAQLPFFDKELPLEMTEKTVLNWGERFVEEAPFNFKEGGFVTSSFSKEIEELSDLISNSREHVVALEQKEKEATGISTLKVGFNRVFGYYIGISKRFSDKVPEHYIRKQTTANAERYFTGELKELEEKILGAKDKLTEIELDVLEDTVNEIENFENDILSLAAFISYVDLFCGFAKMALDNNYCKPEIEEEEGIEIIDGRHPVVEASVPRGTYVPASVKIGKGDRRFSVITGPNMGGKSTLMRMTALTVLLAQTGSYVPAKSAKIGIVDSIYTRVGASDNLSKGESTFLVEMKETATILNRATSKSLIILDEIGRGTGTYDGISLAKAIAEYIIENINATTLFATHYHILTELTEDFPTACNFHMTAREYGGRIRFMYQLKEGGSNRSFGVEVAKLTDMPNPVIRKAEKILKDMEKTDRRIRFERGSSLQTDIFSMDSQSSEHPDHIKETLELIEKTDPNNLTPRQALDVIFKLHHIKNQERR